MTRLKEKMLLPHRGWLRRNGFQGLDFAIYKHPKLFEHIPQACKKRSIEENVTLAENLAHENGGLLPITRWLVTNGYAGLVSVMYRIPDRFKHIRRGRWGKTITDHVRTAEQVAEKNGGLLPATAELIRQGYMSVYQAMGRSPKDFAHIRRQERLAKSIGHYVKEARRIAAMHGGVLPNGQWLRTHGHNNLRASIQTHPEAFVGIKQRHRCTSVVTL